MTALRAIDGEGRAPKAVPALEGALCYRILTDPAEWWSVSGWLREEMFHDHRARGVFAAIAALVESGTTPSMTTVALEGGARVDVAWFEASARGASGISTVGELGRVIANAWRIREGARIAREAARRFDDLSIAPSRAGEIDDAIGQLLSELRTVQSPPGRGVTRATIEGRQDPEPPRISDTGWPGLDQQFGWRRGVTIVGIRSGGGKTTFGLQAAVNVASNGRSALIVGIEQPRCDYETKLEMLHATAAEKGVYIDANDFGRVAIYADDADMLGRAITFAELEGTIDREQERGERIGEPLSLVVIDYVQHDRLIPPGCTDRTPIYERTRSASDRLRLMAEQRGIAICALSQFNRGAEENPKEWPKRSHLLGGSALERDAIAILLGHVGARTKHARELKLRVDKQRWGGDGLTVDMVMHRGAFILEKDGLS